MSGDADLLMPKLGLTMEEGRVAQWNVAPGMPFAAGTILVVVETDKIASDVEAPAAGILTEILVPEGVTVPVSTAIARWRLDADLADRGQTRGSDPIAAAQKGTAAAVAGNESGEAQQARTARVAAPRAEPLPVRSAMASGERRGRHDSGRILATPYARRLAREAELTLSSLTGTGPRGRIQGADVVAHIATRSSTTIAAPQLPVPTPATLLQPAGSPAASAARSLSLVHVTVARAGIAEVLSSLGSMAQTARPLDFVALAARRALPHLAAGEATLGIEISATHGPLRQHLAIDARARLGAVSAAVGEAYRAAADAGAAIARAEGGTLLLVPADAEVTLFAPAAPVHWTAALGITASSGGPLTLALSWNASAVSNAAALAFISTLRQLLEEPLGMLAG